MSFVIILKKDKMNSLLFVRVRSILKFSFSFLEKKIETIGLTFVFLYSFFVRLKYLSPQWLVPDFQREYLVANHILTYGEAFSFAPRNSVFGLTTGSLFYNFLTVVLKINNNLIFLNVINILLQLLALYSLYKISHRVDA